MKIPLVGQAYPSRSAAVSVQDCINVFPARIQDPNEQAKNKAVLYGCPGKHLGATLATDVRGLWSGAGRLFVASGQNLIELNSGFGTVSTHGYAPTNDGLPVQIFSNGNQLLLVSGGKAYCDNGAGPVLITTGSYSSLVNAAAFQVDWLSGDQFLDDGSWEGVKTVVIAGTNYTVAASPKVTKTRLFITVGIAPHIATTLTAAGDDMTAVTGGVMNETFFVQRPPTVGHPEFGAQINFSAVLDGTSWSGLDFFRKEGSPDNIRGILCETGLLYAFGDETFEVFQADPNAGLDGAPYVSIEGAMGRYGCFSSWSMVALDGHIFFLGGDDRGGPVAYILDGFTPRRISTDAEETAWRKAGLGRNAIAYAYQEDGHSFVGWDMGVNGATNAAGAAGAQAWFYDTETGAWHQRYKYTAGAFAPYLTNLHTFIPEWGNAGKHITASTRGPAKVYESSIDFYDDEGTDIKWQRTLPYLYNDGKWQFFGRCDLDMETGTVASGAAPLITLDYSDDRGKTFANPRTAAIGVHDATAVRVFWLRGGKSHGRVPRLSGIGQSKVALVDMDWDITLGVV